MAYLIISPDEKMICYETKNQVAHYCSIQETKELDGYFEDQELEYENMSAVEIGYGYALVGGEKGICKVYHTKEVLKAMYEEGVEKDTLQTYNVLLNEKEWTTPSLCPGELMDVVDKMTPIDLSEFAGKPYTYSKVSTDQNQV